MMNENITFRVVGDTGFGAVKHLPHRILRSDITDVTLPLAHPETVRLFQEDGVPGHSDATGWFITFPRIRRTYSEDEFRHSPVIHLGVMRVFPEAVGELDHYEFTDSCKCLVPKAQIKPILLEAPLKCKDALVRLSEGAWLCKPEFVEALLGSDLEQVAVTPVFNSASKLRSWSPSSSSQKIGPSLDGPIDSYRLSANQLSSFHWVQLHFKIGPYKAVPPTDGRHVPHQEDDPRELCHCDEVYGPGLVSELFLEQQGVASGDWFLTRQFFGTSGGVFLPMRELLVSQKAFEFLKGFRLKNAAFECVHVNRLELD